MACRVTLLAILLRLHDAARFGGFAHLAPFWTRDFDAFGYAAVGDAA